MGRGGGEVSGGQEEGDEWGEVRVGDRRRGRGESGGQKGER